MKKILCVIIAVVIALSSMSIVGFAAKKVPDFTITTSTASAKVGDTVKVSVKVEKGSRLCAIAMDLVYDNTYFEVVSATAGTAVDGVVNAKHTAKRVRFSAAKAEELQIEAVLFTAEFKVLKTNGTFTLDATEVCTTKSNGSANWNDVTEDVQEKLEDYSVTVVCSHANKEEVVLEEPSCSKVGYKAEKCKECDWQSEKAEIPMTEHNKEELVLLQPTCTEAGYKAELCKNCDWESEKTEIPAKGHTEGLMLTVKPATTTEKGLKQQKCIVCGDILAEEEIPMLPPYTLGDVNNDGRITAVDARMVLRAVAGLVELTEVQIAAADTNKDEKITAVDARMILQYVVGKVKF